MMLHFVTGFLSGVVVVLVALILWAARVKHDD